MFLKGERRPFEEINTGVFTPGENLERPVPLEGDRVAPVSVITQDLVYLLKLGVHSLPSAKVLTTILLTMILLHLQQQRPSPRNQ